jgi:hypothetical protein
MKKIVRTALAASITLALTACHNGSKTVTPDPDPTPVVPTTMDISGSAVKGSLALATVNVYNASDAARATVLATAQTDAAGDYEVQVVDASGAAIMGTFVVEILADDDTTMICDATMCGEVARGESIPATELVGLSLSTITYSDGTAINADVNSLTTLATDTILFAAGIEGSAIDLADISATDFLAMQNDSSAIVGAILGVDLSATNLFAIDIVDATGEVSATDAIATDAITATLTLINASLSSLDVADGSTLAASINGYINAVNEITDILLVDADADLGSGDSAAALTIVNATQEKISKEVKNIADEIALDYEFAIPAEELPIEVDVDALGDIIGDITNGTGGTGGTGGEG